MISDTSKSQYKSELSIFCLFVLKIENSKKWLAFKVLDPMEKLPEERKQTLAKVEAVLDGIYKDESIETTHYKAFMEKYTENFEENVKANPEFKFDYKAAMAAAGAPEVKTAENETKAE